MTTQVIDRPLENPGNANMAVIGRAVAAGMLYLAALGTAVGLWKVTYTAVHIAVDPTFAYADWFSLMMREARILLIGCHAIPYALSTSGRLVMGSLWPSTRKIQVGIIVLTLLSLLCAAVTLGIR